MQQNVGPLDSTLRVGIGFGLLFAAFLLPPPAKWLAYAGCVVFVATGVAGKCLLYRLLGVDTSSGKA
jgi:hypothetical protein